ncbi:MAG TPA: hypothetical protein VFV87_14610 [Pirellulaceae bacterium]|nr:hypothetical protein [Pirellulaceae bacterium]
MRRRARRQLAGVSLFPFLAVLICTMGSLIVLLVLLVQQARLDAHTLVTGKSPDPPPADAEQFQRQIEEAQWRRELLERSRAEKSQELADTRAKLAHLEDHIRRLTVQARELLARAQNIDEGKQLKDDQLATAEAELARMNDEIAKKQVELDEARKKLKSQEQWFALIPYQGPNGTRRRPIYIECTSRGVILQPEGLVLQPADFDGPLGPHNPLDAALRTIREYLNRTAPGAGEPYPLLVVRPDGVMAYGAARAALKSWDEEFGYELISSEKKLTFGSPDPGLAAALARSVAVARQRQAAMVAAMPRRYQEHEPLTSFAPDAFPDDPREAGAMGGRGAGRAPGNGHGHGMTGTIPGGTGSASGYPLAGSGAGSPGESIFSPARGGNPGNVGNSAVAGGSAGGGPDNPFGEAGRAGGQFGEAGGSGNQSATGPYGNGNTGQPSGGQPGSAQPGQSSSAGGGSTSGSSGPAASSAGGQMAAASSPQSQGQAGGAPSLSLQLGNPHNSSAAGGQQQNGSSNSAAGAGKGRGRDWALPGASRHATAITRPIYVAVLADRLVVVPQRGTDRQPQQLPISRSMTVAEVDAFVAAVQREMKAWGLAVDNGYWKPVLQMDVAPGAERHFADLQTALENSGFEIERKQR